MNVSIFVISGSETYYSIHSYLHECFTYLQKESPLGLETHIPPFLQGLGEHETKPKKKKKL